MSNSTSPRPSGPDDRPAPPLDPPERILMVPGPTNLHPRVRQALIAPIVSHRDPYFMGVMGEIVRMLQRLFNTSNSATFALPATGGAGMEASLVNLIEPGDSVLIGVAGFFAERMVEIARRCGARVEVAEVEWGQPLEAAQVERAMDRTRPKLVALVHGETSTGMRQPLDEIGRIVRERESLLVVDAVASLGGEPVLCDAWNVDVCFGGSQKCLGAPPGVSPITLSPRALQSIQRRSAPPPTYYFDLSLHTRYWSEEHIYHHTAPVVTLYALYEALRLVFEEGLDNRIQRHAVNSEALRAGLEQLGAAQFARADCRLAPVVTVHPPEQVEEAKVRKFLSDQLHLDIAGGLGEYAGRMWRIGVMGEAAKRQNVLLLLEGLEIALKRQGAGVSGGQAVAAAEAVYSAWAPVL